MTNQYNVSIPYLWTHIFSKGHFWDKRLQRMVKKNMNNYSGGSDISWANLNRIIGPPTH